MKTFKNYTFLVLLMTAVTISCKDDSLTLVPAWETGVHGNGEIADGSSANFRLNDPTYDVTIDLSWISIDNSLTVEKIDVFVIWNESYVDLDQNTKVAFHGGDDGRLFRTFQGAEVPGNREPVTFTLSQENLFELYEDVTFNYGNGSVSVFNNPDNPARTTTNHFLPEDAISVRWEFTTSDGRLFKAWGVSVCTEFPGANCSVDFGVVCATVIEDPPGDYTINMVDSYGDGWNGAAIRVVVDGVGTNYTIDDGAAGTEVVTVPPGTSTLTFEFVSGDWDSEVTFTIVSPKGNVIAKGGPSPTPGELTLDLCKE